MPLWPADARANAASARHGPAVLAGCTGNAGSPRGDAHVKRDRSTHGRSTAVQRSYCLHTKPCTQQRDCTKTRAAACVGGMAAAAGSSRQAQPASGGARCQRLEGCAIHRLNGQFRNLWRSAERQGLRSLPKLAPEKRLVTADKPRFLTATDKARLQGSGSRGRPLCRRPQC